MNVQFAVSVVIYFQICIFEPLETTIELKKIIFNQL